MKMKKIVLFASLLAIGGCKKNEEQPSTNGKAVGTATTSAKSGPVRVDGSSTVFPISQAMAEEFRSVSKARVTIGVSGTGGGFKKFCRGDIDISGASRPIKKTEVALCKENGVEWIELPVAYDGIAVVANNKAEWLTSLTVSELKKVWSPESQEKVTKWSDVRAGFPEKSLNLYGAGVDSGTYDYFTKAIVGKEHSSRGDFTASEDDNVLVQGVSSDVGALGFFGYAYYLENKDRLRLVSVDNEKGSGPIAPNFNTVADGTYQPLSRPIFIYVSTKALEENAEVDKFMNFVLDNAGDLVKEVGYIPLSQDAVGLVRKRLQARTLGSLFEDGSKVGATVEQLLQK